MRRFRGLSAQRNVFTPLVDHSWEVCRPSLPPRHHAWGPAACTGMHGITSNRGTCPTWVLASAPPALPARTLRKCREDEGENTLPQPRICTHTQSAGKTSSRSSRDHLRASGAVTLQEGSRQRSLTPLSRSHAHTGSLPGALPAVQLCEAGRVNSLIPKP